MVFRFNERITRIGENDNEICKLITKDLIKDFIIYVNKNCYPIKSIIDPSIYETCFINDKITLLEYAIFFGSIQIFNYLRQNGSKLDHILIYKRNKIIIFIL